MNPIVITLLGALLLAPAAHATTAVAPLLASYAQQGAGPFSASAGEQLWQSSHTLEGSERRCASCHGANLSSNGKHARTGKPIEPLAPSVNAERFTDPKKIEKWFLRNCKWTFGRTCTTQEKGDLLSYLITQ